MIARTISMLGLTMVIVSSSPLSSQVAPEVPSRVLTSTTSVRFAGFNGAGAALVGHAGTIFSNPAGLATVSHGTVEAGYQTAPDGGYVASAALAWRMGQFDLGFGMKYYDIGTDEGFAVPLTGSFEAMGVGSLVYRFGLIAIGGSGKVVRRAIDGVRHHGSSADLGVAIAVFDIMALGFSVQNVGGNWQSASPIAMPRLARTGFTMNYVDPLGTFRLLSTIEWQWPSGQDSRFVVGVEGGVVIGRVGVVGRFARGSRPSGSPNGLYTFGGTLELAWFDFDVALEPRNAPDADVQHIGMRFAF